MIIKIYISSFRLSVVLRRAKSAAVKAVIKIISCYKDLTFIYFYLREIVSMIKSSGKIRLSFDKRVHFGLNSGLLIGFFYFLFLCFFLL